MPSNTGHWGHDGNGEYGWIPDEVEGEAGGQYQVSGPYTRSEEVEEDAMNALDNRPYVVEHKSWCRRLFVILLVCGATGVGTALWGIIEVVQHVRGF
jgi:hypothetical protein